eukprot:351035-Chlamydomonas_euryale.AAC.3
MRAHPATAQRRHVAGYGCEGAVRQLKLAACNLRGHSLSCLLITCSRGAWLKPSSNPNSWPMSHHDCSGLTP